MRMVFSIKKHSAVLANLGRRVQSKAHGLPKVDLSIALGSSAFWLW
jgi:hypothetical protein